MKNGPRLPFLAYTSKQTNFIKRCYNKNMVHIGHWLIDYIYMAHGQVSTFFYRNPPKHYLEYVKENKNPIILIPGIFEKWAFLKPLADKISLEGHPVYIVPKLGYNLKDIPSSAKIVREMIEENDIKNAVIIAHSKGGLIGKYLLSFFNPDGRVKKMISIATPYSGTALARFLPSKHFKDFRKDSEIIRQLISRKETDGKIVSISPIFDNHVWEGSVLEGAENLTIDEKGHHKIIYNKKLAELILSKL